LIPRNIGLPAIHTRINGVFRKNLLVEEDILGIRDIGLKRKPKKDLSCIILHNLECYQFRCVYQIIQLKQKFLNSWRYRRAYKLSCLHIHHLSLQRLFQKLHIQFDLWQICKYTFHVCLSNNNEIPSIMLRITRISRRRCICLMRNKKEYWKFEWL
jgi:hypothetical protein